MHIHDEEVRVTILYILLLRVRANQNANMVVGVFVNEWRGSKEGAEERKIDFKEGGGQRWSERTLVRKHGLPNLFRKHVVKTYRNDIGHIPLLQRPRQIQNVVDKLVPFCVK